LVVLAIAAAIALSLGAAERGAADTVSGCAGKPLCVAITDTPDPASRSPFATAHPADTDHYLTYSVNVANSGATSNLVNVVVTVTWQDIGAATTSAYQSSDARCTGTATQTLTCTTSKSLGPGASETYELVFRTATELGEPPLSAAATNVTVTVAAKEQTKPSKGGSNTAFVTVSNPTDYEPQPELDVSRGGGGLTTTLATAAGFGGQSSKLLVPGDDAPRGLFELRETSDYTCPVGLKCFGQQVQTVAPDLSPVNVQATYTGELPSGLSESSFVVFHVRDPGTVPLEVTISAACSGALFSGEPPSEDIPCRRVEITHLSKGIATVEWEVWEETNGRFNGG
jgi:hypothetical protein